MRTNHRARENIITNFPKYLRTFSVGSGNVNAGVEAGAVHGFGNVSSKVIFGSGTAVVGSLGSVGHAGFGPTQGRAFVEIKEGKFLFETKPDFLVFVGTKGFHGLGAVVGRNRIALGIVTIAHDENIVNPVVPGPKGIPENSLRF